MTREEFKTKAKAVIDNKTFCGDKFFYYDNMDEMRVAQVTDINVSVTSYPLMDFLEELYEQIKGNLN